MFEGPGDLSLLQSPVTRFHEGTTRSFTIESPFTSDGCYEFSGFIDGLSRDVFVDWGSELVKIIFFFLQKIDFSPLGSTT